MVIRFPTPKRNSIAIKPPKTKPTELYLLLAFMLLYLVAVFWAQHYAKAKRPPATAPHAHLVR